MLDMIHYATSSDVRTRIVVVLALAAFSTVAACDSFLVSLRLELSVPSAFTIFGAYAWIFDRVAWKWPIVCRSHGIPDLTGTWTGAALRADETEYELILYIQQTWTKIQIEAVGDQTRSVASCVSFNLSTPARMSLQYIYEIRPNAEPKDRSVRGTGCQELILDSDRELSGPYFHSRAGKGRLSVVRQ